MEIRKARIGDIKKIMSIYEHARELMRREGNDCQWVNGYPSEKLVAEDIEQGISYVVTDRKDTAGVFAFIEGRDPTYSHIDDGAWEEDERPYATIHRMGRAKGRHGIFRAAMDWCRQNATSLRVDTHEKNHTMRALIERYGFEQRGIIYVADGTPRIAYQLLDTKTICEPLKAYIEEEILPRYDHFDAAHQRSHAEAVIGNSLELAKHYAVDINMVYAIAAYHDTGLAEGRELHHIVSGEIIRQDKALRRWFSERQITVMADAAEDHRASAGHEPRSIYGKIVAEADRDIEPLRIIRRTVEFGVSNYPHLDKEEQWQRAVSHLEEKYGEQGYLKLFLPESHNAENLQQLREIIANKERLRPLFEIIISDEKKIHRR